MQGCHFYYYPKIIICKFSNDLTYSSQKLPLYPVLDESIGRKQAQRFTIHFCVQGSDPGVKLL